MNFLKGFTFKSVASHDQFYVDDGGKKVIFRTINGRVVPIQTDAEEHAEWLLENGVNIDPADQKTLWALDDELEVLQQAGQMGGPAEQARVEKVIQQRRQQAAELSQHWYRQGVQQQAAKQNVTPERLIEDRKKLYEENKDRIVARKDMPDRGWESYTASYVDKMIESAGFEEKSGLWFVMQAYDLMLKKAMDKARDGESPQRMSLDALIDDELSNFDGLKKHWDNYAKFKVDENDFSVERNMFKAVSWLKDNLKETNEATGFLRDAFDAIYGKMHKDFNPQKTQDFEKFKPNSFKVPMEMLPKHLPKTLGASEAGSLQDYYENFPGSKRTAAARTAVHTVARLYDSIPMDERVAAITELGDGSRGLHAVHKASYMRAYHDKEQLGVDVNIPGEIEDILRIAVRAGNKPTRDKIQAMKQISAKLGLIDGAYNLNAKGGTAPTLAKYRNQWADVSLEAGRRKGDGPNLMETLIDDTRLRASIMDNKTLKVMHREAADAPQTEKTPTPDTTPEVPTTETKQVPTTAETTTTTVPTSEKIKKPAREPGKNSQDNNKVVANSGFTMSPDGKTMTSPDKFSIGLSKEGWKITSPDGDDVGIVFPDKSLKPGKRLEKIIQDAKAAISEYTGSAENRMVPGAMFGFFNQTLSNDSKNMLNNLAASINERGLKIKEVVPGALYSVDGAAESIQVGYNKKNASIIFLKNKTPISEEEAHAALGAKEQEPVEEPKPANTEPVNVPSEGESLAEVPPTPDALSVEINRIVEAGEDGFSYEVANGKPLDKGTGYIVSKLDKSREVIVPKGANLQEAVAKFKEENAHEFTDGNSLLGGWQNDNGEWVLDISEKFDNEEDAARAAEERGQTAYYNNVTGQSVYLPQRDQIAEPVTPTMTEETIKENPVPDTVIPGESSEIASREKLAKEKAKPVELNIPEELSNRIANNENSQRQMKELSQFLGEHGLSVENKGLMSITIGGVEGGKDVVIGANELNGSLYFKQVGHFADDGFTKLRHAPLTSFDEILKIVNPEKFEEIEKAKPEPVAKRRKLTKELPKAKKPKEHITWDNNTYGVYGTKVDGTPTEGYARWILNNDGYPSPTRKQINDIIKQHKGVAPRIMDEDGFVASGGILSDLDKKLMEIFKARQAEKVVVKSADYFINLAKKTNPVTNFILGFRFKR